MSTNLLKVEQLVYDGQIIQVFFHFKKSPHPFPEETSPVWGVRTILWLQKNASLIKALGWAVASPSPWIYIGSMNQLGYRIAQKTFKYLNELRPFSQPVKEYLLALITAFTN